MIFASLRMSGSCVEMMEFNGDIYWGFCSISFPHLLHMLSNYAQLFGHMTTPME